MVDRTHEPEIARHGRLAPRTGTRSALRLLGIAVCVLLLSAAGVAAYGVWDVARSVKPGVALSKLGGGTQQDVPDVGALKGGDADANAAALRGVLEGKPSAYRDVALFNAAAALIVAGRAKDLKEGVAIGTKSLDSGAAAAKLKQLIAVSNG